MTAINNQHIENISTLVNRLENLKYLSTGTGYLNGDIVASYDNYINILTEGLLRLIKKEAELICL